MAYMKEALRNIWRRKLRSALTIFGVAIGIFALTTMGSLALYFHKTLNSVLDYYSSRVIVTSSAVAGHAGSFGASGGQIPASLVDRIKVIDGVKAAYPTVSLNASDSSDVGSFRQPELIYAYRPADATADPNPLKVSQGRNLTNEDRGKVVIGTNVALANKYTIGQSVTLHGKQFEIIGILERTTGEQDSYYVMHLDDAQPLVAAQNPFNVEAATFVTSIVVIPNQNVSGDDLANRIKSTISGVSATPPETFKKEVQNSSRVFYLIVLGSALIAVVVGSLSVINTMVMSVSERRREIGIKRVVGARGIHILRETVAETAAMALIGGVLGCLGGWVLTSLINQMTADQGLKIFEFNWLVILVALGFALGLGILAGIYPAWRAGRIKPVQVLREE